jgi:uncharacterized protein YkwD
MRNSSTYPNLLKPSLALLAAAVLVACGGGSDAGNGTPATDSTTSTSTSSNPSASGAAAPPPVAAAQSCDLPDFSKDLLDRVNAARTAPTGTRCNGVVQPAAKVLNWSTQLAAAAAAHSQDMAARNTMEHNGADGKGVDSRVTAQGYTWSWVGENIAAGQGSVESAMSSWLNSKSGHCESIVAKEAVHIGVACVRATNSTPYWTMVLARPGS